MAFGIRGGCLEEEEPELSLKEAFQIEGDSANQGMEETRSSTRVPLCFGHWCAGKHLTTGSRNMATLHHSLLSTRAHLQPPVK